MGEYTVDEVRVEAYLLGLAGRYTPEEMLRAYAALLERQAQWPSDEPTDRMVDAALALQGEDALLAKAPALTSAIVKIYKAMRAVAPVQASAEWIERWEGSGPRRGWHIREKHPVLHGNEIAYLGDTPSSEEISTLIARHNGRPAMCDGGCPEKQVCDYCQPSSGKDASAPQPPKVQAVDVAAIREVIADLRADVPIPLRSAVAEKLTRAIGDKP